jgi:hypothetical protein
MENSLDDCPRISVSVEPEQAGLGTQTAENIPVIEGADTLSGHISGKYGNERLYLFQSAYFPAVAVLARTKQAAWDYLADYGVLDGMKVPRDEAQASDRHYFTAGNACESFDIDWACMLVCEFQLSDIIQFHQRLKFGRDGWMHIWDNYNDAPPYRDLIVQVDGDLNPIAWTDRNTPELNAESVQERVHSRIWGLINEHC